MARLIDTTVIIDVERQAHPISVLHEIAAGEPIAISSVSAAELLLGVERADTPERRQRRAEFVESVVKDIPVLPFDLSVAKHDLMIAATALTHGYPMLTENVRDFERVPGLVVRRPDWQQSR